MSIHFYRFSLVLLIFMKGEHVMYEIFSELLQRYGLTPYKVSKEIGISQSTLSDWKRGKSTPKIDKLQKIADYFGVSVEYLTTGKDESEKKAPTITPKDERDIAKDLESIMSKLSSKEDGPASFDGTDIPEADQELFAGQIELMLRRLKAINKELYNPNKNKK